MYDPSNYNEDLHINNEGDSALLETVFNYLNEARVYAPEKPKSSNVVYGPEDSLTREQRAKYNQLQNKIAIGKAIREEKPKEQVDFTHKKPGIRDVTPDHPFNKKNVGSFVKKNAPKIAGAAVITAGKKMLNDYENTGDPFHTVKKIKSKIDEKREAAAKNKKNKKDREDFEKWIDENKKKKVLKEDCELLIDESSGTVYYSFDVPEGV